MTSNEIDTELEAQETEFAVARKPADDWRQRKDYLGEDLKPYDGRPGALDFLTKPSRELS